MFKFKKEESKIVKYKEEIYATTLYKDLKNKFKTQQAFIFKFLNLTTDTSKPSFEISVKKEGVHCQCAIATGQRKCTIACFHFDNTVLDYKGPEYCTSFEENGKPIAAGRTFSKQLTLNSIENWLENKTLEELYLSYSFIDEGKRKLQLLQKNINDANAKLTFISVNEVKEEYFSSYSLWFRHDNKSCKIYYYGYEENPRYVFNWDDCRIFETSSSDVQKMGSLIKKWTVEKAMPSTLRIEFPEIDFGALAEYYESGNGIKGEFINSWDQIEQFYKETDLDKKDEILRLIKGIRAKGFDKTLRAGQSLYSFVLSRSRRHGLRENQPFVSFSFVFIRSAMEVRTQKNEPVSFYNIEYNETIEKLLKKLELEEIN